jgi:hypothetical protein
MPCACTAKSLRLFIKTVAQVELPSTIPRTPWKQWQKGATRSFSSSLPSRNDNIAFKRGPPRAEDQSTQSKSWPQGSTEDGIAYRDAEPAPTVAAPAGKLSKVARRKLERYDPVTGNPLTGEPKQVARRTKTMNTSFQLHFSAPRAPLAAAPPKPDPKLKTAFRPTKDGGEWKPPPREHWQVDKAALKEKFPEGWKPLKKLSPDALAGIRALHAQSPEQYTTEVLASNFQISPEAIRRILKSKWTPNSDEETDRQRRWLNRGKAIYQQHADAGQKPPKMWRDMGVGKGKPEWMLKKQRLAERAPLPALITTSRARDAKYGVNMEVERLEDRML